MYVYSSRWALKLKTERYKLQSSAYLTQTGKNKSVNKPSNKQIEQTVRHN